MVVSCLGVATESDAFAKRYRNKVSAFSMRDGSKFQIAPLSHFQVEEIDEKSYALVGCNEAGESREGCQISKAQLLT